MSASAPAPATFEGTLNLNGIEIPVTLTGTVALTPAPSNTLDAPITYDSALTEDAQ